MTIRARLTLALGLLLLSTIVAIISALLLDARHRVNTEVSSSLQTAETLLRSSLDSLDDADGHHEKIEDLVASLNTLRHVRIHLESAGAIPPPPVNETRIDEIAQFFSVEPGPPVRLPVRSKGQLVDTLVITPARNDEFNEVLETIGRVALYALAFAAAAFSLTTWLINRAIAPIDDLGAAMHAMEEGQYDIGVPQHGPPEIARIGDQLNRLATALRRSRAENQRLSIAMVKIQDEERRDIARDLHDELGPVLFSIRATGSALTRQLENVTSDDGKALNLTREILEHVDALQSTNRRVLHQLSPVGLAELGLTGVLEASVAMWKRQADAPDIRLEIADDIDKLDPTITTTIYRVVQEGLTNAFRHAGASVISIDVDRADATAEMAHAAPVTVSIVDDGEGLPDETTPGFGLKGMRERVTALGGTIDIVREGTRGTRVQASIPIAGQPLQTP